MIHSTSLVASATYGFGRKQQCGEPSTGSFGGLRSAEVERRWKRGVKTPVDDDHLWSTSTDQNLRVGDGTPVRRCRESRNRVHDGYVIVQPIAGTKTFGSAEQQTGDTVGQRPISGDLAPRKTPSLGMVKGSRWLIRCGQTLEWRPRLWEAGRRRCLHPSRPTW
jgi:hypothetical protein